MLPFTDHQAAELGAGVGIPGMAIQFALHGLAQPLGFIGTGEQFRPVAVVKDGWFAAVGDAPLGFAGQQLPNAVVDHRVIWPAPADGGMAAEQTADAGVGRHGGSHLVTQQVDHQHIGLCHQGLEAGDDLRSQLFIGIQHQHPVAVEEGEGGVAGGSEITWPLHLFHPSAGRFSHSDRRVGGSGVHHHHLVGKIPHGGQAARQPRLLVAHNHRETEHRRRLGLAGG